MYEYRSTVGKIYSNDEHGEESAPEWADGSTSSADDPREPPGRGWELAGTAASGRLLIWTWRKAVNHASAKGRNHEEEEGWIGW